VSEGKLADLKLDAGFIGKKISYSPGGFREPPDYDGIALAVVALQNILRIERGAIVDFQLVLAPASRGANPLGRKSRSAAWLIGFLEQQHPRALLGGHERRHQPAPAGADDNDIAIYVLHGISGEHPDV
jgi:hypothetical protein